MVIHCKNYREAIWCGGRNIRDFVQILQLPGNDSTVCCNKNCRRFSKNCPKAPFSQLLIHISHRISHLKTESGIIKAPKLARTALFSNLSKNTTAVFIATHCSVLQGVTMWHRFKLRHRRSVLVIR